ncbi:MAG: hypothetical protein ACI8ZM_004586 [Crocinitomix sp.]|jgi:hypothetical protein
MFSNKDKTAGIIILIITTISVVAFNGYSIKSDLLSWFTPITTLIALLGFLISLCFFFLANSHFKKILEHHQNRLIGWLCMAVFIGFNLAANYIGFDELARIKHW